MMHLPQNLIDSYTEHKQEIQKRLEDFANIPINQYFYELCYCLCTPQSKARAAFQVQNKLMELDFVNNDVDLESILSNPSHYIRFHNQKSESLRKMKMKYSEIEKVLQSNLSPQEKRFWLNDNIRGIGLKESAHFLRNIGYKNLAILDRHILRNLILCDVIEKIPENFSSNKIYLAIEQKFLEFAEQISIPIDELDLLFWRDNTGEILK